METIATKFTHPTAMTASDSACIQFERLLEQHEGIGHTVNRAQTMLEIESFEREVN